MDSDQLFFTDKIASPSGQYTVLDWTLGEAAVMIYLQLRLDLHSRNLPVRQVSRLPTCMRPSLLILGMIAEALKADPKEEAPVFVH